ncbi:TlpA disulfide reductase family protein [Bergeyella zoohelcum]|uniref:TlpA family protein disulfide reductase n=1 Tax=Bergeyella zoohelcum TaxID=1015 RepID=UPI002A90F72B|nr:TlpA disulfide reductase family protein [Bergeyella zoohelcum]MDY6024624.1 TlpA disulfide reductase family protein [Bergeyella zoohelcum]
MRKLIGLFLLGLLFIACSKKIEIEGTVKGGSPLERLEITEASGVATLPLINIGADEKGKFTGSFEAPKNGMYLLSYGGQQNIFFLKRGQKFEFQGQAGTFPTEFTIKGEAYANNEFLKQAQKALLERTKRVDIMQELQKGEENFVAVFTKIQNELEKKFDELAEKHKADKEVLQWKKADLRTGILSVIPQVIMMKKQTSGNPNYKPHKSLADFENKLQDNSDELLKEHPLYRQYLLSKISDDFQKFVEKNQGKVEQSTTQLFVDFLKGRKELTQTAKDYLTAFIIAQYELSQNTTEDNKKKLNDLIEKEIKDTSVKESMKKLLFVIGGFSKGEEAPKATLKTTDGKSFSLDSQKGKPTLLVTYASWTLMLQEINMPIIKQMVDFYKSKFNVVYINFDDTEAQFKKTSSALLKGYHGTPAYAEGGLNSEFAKKYGIYAFKLAPGLLVLDKEGKIAGPSFYNPGEQEFVKLMDQLSGLKAPEISQDGVSLQNDLLSPPTSGETPAAEAPKTEK